MAMAGGGAAAAKRCMNPACGGPASSVVGAGGDWRKGWPLRSGGFALLCDNCGYGPPPPFPLFLSYAPPASSCEWGLDWMDESELVHAVRLLLSPPLFAFRCFATLFPLFASFLDVYIEEEKT